MFADRPAVVAVAAGPLLALTVFGCSKSPTTPPRPPVLASISPTSARPGQAVTMRGSGFQPGAVVTFGGVSATFISVTQAGTVMTVTAPVRSAGLVDIVVINPDGQRGS